MKGLDVSMSLVDEFFEMERKRTGNQNKVRIDGESAVIFHDDKKYYYVPDVIIKDIGELDKALEEYLRAVKQSKLEFANYSGRHEDYTSYYLRYLYRNMSNEDYQDLTAYVKKYTKFILDGTFSEYDCRQMIGEYKEQNIFAQRITGERGTETPYTMQFSAEPSNPEEEMYTFPFIRYGVSDVNNQKTVEIFTVQRGTHKQEGEYVEHMKKLIRGVNTGLKDFRDVDPYYVASMAMFIQLLHNDGLRSIIVPDTMSYRYGVFKGVTDEEDRNRIQTNITDKFMDLFLRLESQIDGFNIVALPNDIDSFMHIKLGDEVRFGNHTLQGLCNIKNIEYKDITKKEETDREL